MDPRDNNYMVTSCTGLRTPYKRWQPAYRGARTLAATCGPVTVERLGSIGNGKPNEILAVFENDGEGNIIRTR